MTVDVRTGDLFASSDLDALGHGCNCAGAMGAGIAKEFRRHWPGMYEQYRRLCVTGQFSLGNIFTYPGDGFVIYNLATQEHWRSKAELWAIEESVRAMLEDARDRGIDMIGIPRIGAGLGGLPWARVQETLYTVAAGSSVRVIVHEK